MNNLLAWPHLVMYGVIVAILMLLWHAIARRRRCHRNEFVLRVYLSTENEQAGSRDRTPQNVPPSEADGEGKGEVGDTTTRFLVDALLLQESFQFLCGGAQGSLSGSMLGFRENFHYVSGLRVDVRTYAISHIVPVEYAHQSAGGVRVADTSNMETLSWLDQVGLPLVCHAHSHPGFGAGATTPSSTDRQFQERLERGGHVAIGVIFSRDGYGRFFAGEGRPFVVEVQGNQVEKVGDNVYRLTLDDEGVSVRAAGR